jgi:AAA ATPase domain
VAPGLVSTAERFLGRAPELHLIDGACTAAAEGRGTVTMVSGEAGIGKTRLCDEVAARAGDAGLTVVTARCWVDGGAPALWPWQPIVRDLCGDATADLLAGDSGHGTVDPDRFARFQAVSDRVAAACRRNPVCMIVDDVHAADAGSLLLIRFVARSLRRLPLALVLSRRPGEPTEDSPRPRLLDEIEREAQPVVLQRFDLDETAAFLAAHGWEDPDPDLVLAVRRVTGGNPLFLRRVAALGSVGPGDALPGGVHTAIDQAVGGLDPGTRRTLQRASVLGLTPSVTEAARVAGTEGAAVLDAVTDGATAGLVRAEGPDRFAFSHELVRSALEGGMPGAERLDTHARAAAVVAGDWPWPSPARLARRAHHALAAAPRSSDDADAAVAACRAAARSMVASFAYEQADALLSGAVELHERASIGTPLGGVLVEWAQAALLCGRLGDARVRFGRAATVAQGEGNAVMLAEAALGLGGHWLDEQRAPVERARVLGLQQAALAGLPAGEEGLRCRLGVRLAAESAYDGGPIEAVLDALAAARRCRDPVARAEALSLCHHALLDPGHARFRLDLADELVQVASRAGHGVLALLGLCWRAVDLFLLGDSRALRALEDLRQRADALGCQNVIYIVDVIDVMLLVRAGRLAEAEVAAGRCYEQGCEVGDADTLAYLSAHMLGIRWIQGRDAELLDLADQVAASPTLVQSEFAFRATSAALAARAGQRERARATLDHLASGGLAALPRSSTWLLGMVAIVEAAAALGDGDVAGQAYDLLLPFADLPAMASLAVVCLGSTERALGVAARVRGDKDAAVDHLERAVVANQRLENAPLVAISRAELAATLRARDHAGDAARAADLLLSALVDADRLGMTGRAAAWRAALPFPPLAPPLAPTPAIPPAAARAPVTDGPGGGAGRRRGVIVRHGRGWLVGIGDRRALVPDLVGMGYLAQLLERPGQPIPALTLTGGDARAGGSRHEVLDGPARAAYAARARELTDDLAEAETNNDIGRAERLRVELDALVEQLEAATGLGGRPRTFTDQTERARTAVRKTIKRAIDQIAAVDPPVGALLRSAVVTGTACVYSPQAGVADITWSTHEAVDAQGLA